MPPTQLGPIGVRQINRSLYVGQSDLPNLQSAVNFAVAQGGNWQVIIPAGYPGGDNNISAVTGGSTNVYITDALEAQPLWYRWNGTQYVEADVILKGSLQAPYINATEASFDDCYVDGSPVRTFANTPDGGGGGGGPDYPPAGIGVSTGTTWAATSIPPSDVPRLSAVNTFQSNNYFAEVVLKPFPVATTFGSQLYIRPATPNLTPSPIIQAGDVVLIAGNQDGASSGAITMAASSASPIGYRIDGNAGSSAWWGPLAIKGAITSDLSITTNALGSVTPPSNGLKITYNLSNGGGETDFINNGAGGFRWYNTTTGTPLTSSTPALMALANNGNLSVTGTIAAAGAISAPSLSTPGTITATGAITGGSIASNGTLTAASMTTPGTITATGAITGGSIASNGGVAVQGQVTTFYPSLRMSYIANVGYLDSFGPTTATPGTMQLRMISSNASVVVNALQLDAAGNVHVAGTLSAATKSFRIPHPTEDGKWLVHGSLEGPEYGVYYRGEGVTVDSWTEIELPDYFEALTQPEDRTVQLTPYFEDEAELCGTVASSRVKEGKFKVWSALPAQKFYWQVTAVRRDVAALEVKQERVDPPTQGLPQQEDNAA